MDPLRWREEGKGQTGAKKVSIGDSDCIQASDSPLWL